MISNDLVLHGVLSSEDIQQQAAELKNANRTHHEKAAGFSTHQKRLHALNSRLSKQA